MSIVRVHVPSPWSHHHYVYSVVMVMLCHEYTAVDASDALCYQLGSDAVSPGDPII